jgi:Na+/serine symporter
MKKQHLIIEGLKEIVLKILLWSFCLPNTGVFQVIALVFAETKLFNLLKFKQFISLILNYFAVYQLVENYLIIFS